MAWKRRLCLKVDVKATLLFLVHNGGTSKLWTVFLGWQVWRSLRHKSWAQADSLQSLSWQVARGVKKGEGTCFHVGQNSSWEQGAKTTSVEAEIPKRPASDWCSSLCRASDCTNSVTGNPASLWNSSRCLCQTVGSHWGWATNCQWWIA